MLISEMKEMKVVNYKCLISGWVLEQKSIEFEHCLKFFNLFFSCVRILPSLDPNVTI